MKISYRVNFNKLKENEELLGSEYFYSHLSERDEIEKIFERRRPDDKPTRFYAKFVFPDLETAKSWYAKKPKHKLYEIAVEETDILHIGDWMWLSKAQQNGDIENCADNYWQSNSTDNPVIEWIINKGIIKSEIQISLEERNNLIAERYGLPSLNDIAKSYKNNK